VGDMLPPTHTNQEAIWLSLLSLGQSGCVLRVGSLSCSLSFLDSGIHGGLRDQEVVGAERVGSVRAGLWGAWGDHQHLSGRGLDGLTGARRKSEDPRPRQDSKVHKMHWVGKGEESPDQKRWGA
jgi:hypothetical protein